MISFLLSILSLGGAIYFSQLLRSFNYMSQRECRRRAEAGQPIAQRIWLARRYRLAVWVVIGGLLSLSLLFFALSLIYLLPDWLAVILSLFVFIVLQVLSPLANWPTPSPRLASQASPWLSKVFKAISPVLRALSTRWGDSFEPEPVARVRSRADFNDRLRFLPLGLTETAKEELLGLQRLLAFADKRINALMIPRKKIRALSDSQILSPHVLGQLHDSGLRVFPVTAGQTDKFIGSLHLDDLTELMRGEVAVKEKMRPDVCYLHQLSGLDDVLAAFLQTNKTLFLAVNNRGRVVGLITVKDVLSQIIDQTGPNANRYDDPAAVLPPKSSQEGSEYDEAS